MRIFLIVIACLAMLMAVVMGLMVAGENLGGKNQERLKEAKAGLAQVEAMGKKLGVKVDGNKELSQAAAMLDRVEGYTTSGIAGIFLALLPLAAVVTIFIKKKLPILVVCGATILLALLFIILAPSFDSGEFGPASPRSQVLVFGIPAMIAAAAAFGADRIRLARQT